MSFLLLKGTQTSPFHKKTVCKVSQCPGIMSPARIGHMVPTGLEGDLVIFLIPVAMPPARLFIIVPYYSNKPTPQNSCLQSLPTRHNAASMHLTCGTYRLRERSCQHRVSHPCGNFTHAELILRRKTLCNLCIELLHHSRHHGFHWCVVLWSTPLNGQKTRSWDYCGSAVE